MRRRKSYVVAAVKSGLISLEDACHQYSFTAEEFQGWQSEALLFAATGPRPIVSSNSVARAKPDRLDKDGWVRARAQTAVHASNGHAQSLIITGNLTVDLDAKVANVGGLRLVLTRKEFEVMQLLVMYKGVTLTKEMFLSRLYGCANARSPKLIDVFICKLRKKLAVACNGDRHIATSGDAAICSMTQADRQRV